MLMHGMALPSENTFLLFMRRWHSSFAWLEIARWVDTDAVVFIVGIIVFLHAHVDETDKTNNYFSAFIYTLLKNNA